MADFSKADSKTYLPSTMSNALSSYFEDFILGNLAFTATWMGWGLKQSNDTGLVDTSLDYAISDLNLARGGTVYRSIDFRR